jgi:hypothetical protein
MVVMHQKETKEGVDSVRVDQLKQRLHSGE